MEDKIKEELKKLKKSRYLFFRFVITCLSIYFITSWTIGIIYLFIDRESAIDLMISTLTKVHCMLVFGYILNLLIIFFSKRE